MVQESTVPVAAESVGAASIALVVEVYAAQALTVQEVEASVGAASTALVAEASAVPESIAPAVGASVVQESTAVVAGVSAVLESIALVDVMTDEVIGNWRAGQNPTLRSDLYVLSQDNRILYLEPDSPDWITINSRYKEIFDRFDGRTSWTGVVDYIEHHHPEESELLIGQIAELLGTSKLFVENAKLPHSSVTKSQPTLKYVYLTLTDCCNLNCSYCYARERQAVDGLSYDEWIQIIDGLLGFTSPIVFTFTGGEPLLVDCVLDLARYINKKGAKCILLTNGTMIRDSAFAGQLAEAFTLIKISLDSHLPEVSSALRGATCLDQVERAVQLLRQARATFTILATVTRLNKDHLAGLLKRFDNAVQFQPLYRMGAATANDHLFLSGEEYFDALAAAGVIKSLSVYHQNIHGFRCRPRKRCAMSSEELSIGPNGDLYPCHMLHYPELKIGNLAQGDRIDVLYTSKPLCELREISVDSLTQCRQCVVRNFCAGACRARLDYRQHGLVGMDPFCVFERKLILDALLYSYG